MLILGKKVKPLFKSNAQWRGLVSGIGPHHQHGIEPCTSALESVRFRDCLAILQTISTRSFSIQPMRFSALGSLYRTGYHFSNNATILPSFSVECGTNQCHDEPCKNGGICLVLDKHGYECSCKKGYSGKCWSIVILLLLQLLKMLSLPSVLMLLFLSLFLLLRCFCYVIVDDATFYHAIAG